MINYNYKIEPFKSTSSIVTSKSIFIKKYLPKQYFNTKSRSKISFYNYPLIFSSLPTTLKADSHFLLTDTKENINNIKRNLITNSDILGFKKKSVVLHMNLKDVTIKATIKDFYFSIPVAFESSTWGKLKRTDYIIAIPVEQNGCSTFDLSSMCPSLPNVAIPGRCCACSEAGVQNRCNSVSSMYMVQCYNHNSEDFLYVAKTQDPHVGFSLQLESGDTMKETSHYIPWTNSTLSLEINDIDLVLKISKIDFDSITDETITMGKSNQLMQTFLNDIKGKLMWEYASLSTVYHLKNIEYPKPSTECTNKNFALSKYLSESTCEEEICQPSSWLDEIISNPTEKALSIKFANSMPDLTVYFSKREMEVTFRDKGSKTAVPTKVELTVVYSDVTSPAPTYTDPRRTTKPSDNLFTSSTPKASITNVVTRNTVVYESTGVITATDILDINNGSTQVVTVDYYGNNNAPTELTGCPCKWYEIWCALIFGCWPQIVVVSIVSVLGLILVLVCITNPLCLVNWFKCCFGSTKDIFNYFRKGKESKINRFDWSEINVQGPSLHKILKEKYKKRNLSPTSTFACESSSSEFSDYESNSHLYNSDNSRSKISQYKQKERKIYNKYSSSKTKKVFNNTISQRKNDKLYNRKETIKYPNRNKKYNTTKNLNSDNTNRSVNKYHSHTSRKPIRRIHHSSSTINSIKGLDKNYGYFSTNGDRVSSNKKLYINSSEESDQLELLDSVSNLDLTQVDIKKKNKKYNSRNQKNYKSNKTKILTPSIKTNSRVKYKNKQIVNKTNSRKRTRYLNNVIESSSSDMELLSDDNITFGLNNSKNESFKNRGNSNRKTNSYQNSRRQYRKSNKKHCRSLWLPAKSHIQKTKLNLEIYDTRPICNQRRHINRDKNPDIAKRNIYLQREKIKSNSLNREKQNPKNIKELFVVKENSLYDLANTLCQYKKSSDVNIIDLRDSECRQNNKYMKKKNSKIPKNSSKSTYYTKLNNLEDHLKLLQSEKQINLPSITNKNINLKEDLNITKLRKKSEHKKIFDKRKTSHISLNNRKEDLVNLIDLFESEHSLRRILIEPKKNQNTPITDKAFSVFEVQYPSLDINTSNKNSEKTPNSEKISYKFNSGYTENKKISLIRYNSRKTFIRESSTPEILSIKNLISTGSRKDYRLSNNSRFKSNNFVTTKKLKKDNKFSVKDKKVWDSRQPLGRYKGNHYSKKKGLSENNHKTPKKAKIHEKPCFKHSIDLESILPIELSTEYTTPRISIQSVNVNNKSCKMKTYLDSTTMKFSTTVNPRLFYNDEEHNNIKDIYYKNKKRNHSDNDKNISNKDIYLKNKKGSNMHFSSISFQNQLNISPEFLYFKKSKNKCFSEEGNKSTYTSSQNDKNYERTRDDQINKDIFLYNTPPFTLSKVKKNEHISKQMEERSNNLKHIYKNSILNKSQGKIFDCKFSNNHANKDKNYIFEDSSNGLTHKITNQNKVFSLDKRIKHKKKTNKNDSSTINTSPFRDSLKQSVTTDNKLSPYKNIYTGKKGLFCRTHSYKGANVFKYLGSKNETIQKNNDFKKRQLSNNKGNYEYYSDTRSEKPLSSIIDLKTTQDYKVSTLFMKPIYIVSLSDESLKNTSKNRSQPLNYKSEYSTPLILKTNKTTPVNKLYRSIKYIGNNSLTNYITQSNKSPSTQSNIISLESTIKPHKFISNIDLKRSTNKNKYYMLSSDSRLSHTNLDKINSDYSNYYSNFSRTGTSRKNIKSYKRSCPEVCNNESYRRRKYIYKDADILDTYNQHIDRTNERYNSQKPSKSLRNSYHVLKEKGTNRMLRSSYISTLQEVDRSSQNNHVDKILHENVDMFCSNLEHELNPYIYNDKPNIKSMGPNTVSFNDTNNVRKSSSDGSRSIIQFSTPRSEYIYLRPNRFQDYPSLDRKNLIHLTRSNSNIKNPEFIHFGVNQAPLIKPIYQLSQHKKSEFDNHRIKSSKNPRYSLMKNQVSNPMSHLDFECHQLESADEYISHNSRRVVQKPRSISELNNKQSRDIQEILTPLRSVIRLPRTRSDFEYNRLKPISEVSPPLRSVIRLPRTRSDFEYNLLKPISAVSPPLRSVIRLPRTHSDFEYNRLKPVVEVTPQLRSIIRIPNSTPGFEYNRLKPVLEVSPPLRSIIRIPRSNSEFEYNQLKPVMLVSPPLRSITRIPGFNSNIGINRLNLYTDPTHTLLQSRNETYEDNLNTYSLNNNEEVGRDSLLELLTYILNKNEQNLINSKVRNSNIDLKMRRDLHNLLSRYRTKIPSDIEYLLYSNGYHNISKINHLSKNNLDKYNTILLSNDNCTTSTMTQKNYPLTDLCDLDNLCYTMMPKSSRLINNSKNIDRSQNQDSAIIIITPSDQRLIKFNSDISINNSQNLYVNLNSINSKLLKSISNQFYKYDLSQCDRYDKDMGGTPITLVCSKRIKTPLKIESLSSIDNNLFSKSVLNNKLDINSKYLDCEYLKSSRYMNQRFERNSLQTKNQRNNVNDKRNFYISNKQKFNPEKTVKSEIEVIPLNSINESINRNSLDSANYKKKTVILKKKLSNIIKQAYIVKQLFSSEKKINSSDDLESIAIKNLADNHKIINSETRETSLSSKSTIYSKYTLSKTDLPSTDKEKKQVKLILELFNKLKKNDFEKLSINQSTKNLKASLNSDNLNENKSKIFNSLPIVDKLLANDVNNLKLSEKVIEQSKEFLLDDLNDESAYLKKQICQISSPKLNSDIVRNKSISKSLIPIVNIFTNHSKISNSHNDNQIKSLYIDNSLAEVDIISNFDNEGAKKTKNEINKNLCDDKINYIDNSLANNQVTNSDTSITFKFSKEKSSSKQLVNRVTSHNESDKSLLATKTFAISSKEATIETTKTKKYKEFNIINEPSSQNTIIASALPKIKFSYSNCLSHTVNMKKSSITPTKLRSDITKIKSEFQSITKSDSLFKLKTNKDDSRFKINEKNRLNFEENKSLTLSYIDKSSKKSPFFENIKRSINNLKSTDKKTIISKIQNKNQVDSVKTQTAKLNSSLLAYTKIESHDKTDGALMKKLKKSKPILNDKFPEKDLYPFSKKIKTLKVDYNSNEKKNGLRINKDNKNDLKTNIKSETKNQNFLNKPRIDILSYQNKHSSNESSLHNNQEKVKKKNVYMKQKRLEQKSHEKLNFKGAIRININNQRSKEKSSKNNASLNKKQNIPERYKTILNKQANKGGRSNKNNSVSPNKEKVSKNKNASRRKHI